MKKVLSAAELLDRHSSVQLVTIDFFDTLVTRRVAQPTHVFAEVERQLCALGGRRWAHLAQRRVWAERRARSVAHDDDRYRDVTFEEILRELQSDMELTSDEVELVRSLECAIEVQWAQPVPWGQELVAEVEKRGLPLLILSDNYMASSQLIAMAHAAGYTQLDESQIFVSCEHGAMKHNGRLFREMLDMVNVPAKHILHVGDDVLADETQPSRLGMKTHLDRRMRRSHRDMDNTAPSVLALSRIEAVLRDTMYETGWSTEQAIGGGVLAMIVAAQIADVERVISQRNVAGVYFAARDGWLAHQVWDNTMKAKHAVPASYLAFSRSVLGRANITRVDDAVALRFIDEHERLSPRQIGERFDCLIVSSHNQDATVDAHTARSIMQDNEAAIVAACQKLRGRVVGYLASVGLLRPGHHVIVDMGWTGATVADLADLITQESNGRTTIEGRFVGLYWDATKHRTRLAMTGLAMDDVGSLNDNVRLLGAIRFFETLMTAPDGSVIDFAGEAGGYAPIYAHNNTESRQYGDVIAAVSSAVVDSASQVVLGTHASGVSMHDIDRESLWAAMMQVSHSPRRDEVHLMASLRHVASVDHRDDGIDVVAKPPRFSSTIPIDKYGEIFDRTMKRHWLQGSVDSWTREKSSQLFAHEMYRIWPFLNRCWIDNDNEG